MRAVPYILVLAAAACAYTPDVDPEAPLVLNSLAGEVVVGGTEATAHDQRIGIDEHEMQHVGDAPEVVADLDLQQ